MQEKPRREEEHEDHTQKARVRRGANLAMNLRKAVHVRSCRFARFAVCKTSMIQSTN